MFCNILKMLRKKHGYSQSEFGKLIGVSKSAVSMYELGQRVPDLELLHTIANLFNVSIDYLSGRESTPTPEAPQLSEGEQLLLDMFRQIPEEQQKVFLEMGRVYANSLKKD